MKLIKNNKQSKMNKLPKTFIYTGESDLPTKITHYQYTSDSFEQLPEVQDPSDTHRDMIVVEGFQDSKTILELTKKFGINDFFVEDIFNVSQRNKHERTDDHVFIVLKYANIENDVFDFRRMYFILKKELVLLFTDYQNSYVDILLERINEKVALFPSYDESYIVYAIYDMIIDEQLEMTRILKRQLEELETVVMESSKTLSQDLFTLHRRLVLLRNNVRSLSENVSPKDIVRDDKFHENLTPFIIDLEDHIMNLKEKLNTNIDVCNALITMYSTQISNRTNDVMKILTIISVIFIPLSFLAGVFGMNFVNFPLLQNENGFLLFTIISMFLAGSMLLYFRYKKWL